MAAVTEDMPILSPKIHKITVRPIVTTTIVSSCDSGPSFSSFFAASRGASGVSWISGGMSLNTSSGMTARPTMAGTHAALNHVSHGDAITTPRLAASFSDNKFCAAAVMHIAEECPDDCSCVWMRNAPSLLAVGPGSDPAFFASDLMIGRYTPPARAVVEGIAGASNASEMLRPYDRPSVDLPIVLTKNVATRSPSPVCTKPLAKKNASTMSQMTSLVIAEKACWNVSVFVTTVVLSPRNAHAPTGRGVKTKPVMVLRKMASSVHACGATAAGHGMRNCTARPTPTESAAACSLAPFHTNEEPEGDASPRSAAEKVTALPAEAVAATARRTRAGRGDARTAPAEPRDAVRKDSAGDLAGATRAVAAPATTRADARGPRALPATTAGRA